MLKVVIITAVKREAKSMFQINIKDKHKKATTNIANTLAFTNLAALHPSENLNANHDEISDRSFINRFRFAKIESTAMSCRIKT